MNERSIFLGALDQDDPTQRSAFLDRACAGDAVLRQRVEALLRSHVEAGNFLGKLAPQRVAEALAMEPTSDLTLRSAPGGDQTSEDLGFLTPTDKPDARGRLGHYDILEVVGKGGMGIVLRAFDEKLHRVVAIKVMAAQLATSASSRKRFTREAQAQAAVSHDHVVTIHAVEEDGPLPYLVMQYIAGPSLQQRLDRDGPLELLEILRIGMQTASALAAAHAQGLVHRDIKPANILFENGVDRVKITDFGLARAAAEASLSQSGVIAGTPQFMSPEQARGDAVDQRTDLFSLGSVLYAMCTGRAPFRANGPMAVLKRVCEETPTPIRDTHPQVPDWLVALIDKLHAKDPAQRYQTAAEVAELLSRYLAHVQHPSLAPPPHAPVTKIAGGEGRSHKRSRRWAIAVAGLLLLFGGLSLTEAIGVTNLRTTVIRIFTPDGTLVVETGDPAVKVTIESDGGLLFTGAGLEEIRLRPGRYKVLADKDGKRVPLERELVSITKGGREVVKVKVETPSRQAAATTGQGAFVLLAAGTERKFDTLAEAVQTACDGDTLEIRGNGPFVSKPIAIGGRALTIRAGSGFRPVLKISQAKPDDDLISTSASLVLEGLEIRDLSKDRSPGPRYSLLFATGKSIHLANCRLVQEEPLTIRLNLRLITAPSTIILRNCEFHTPGAAIASFANDVPSRFVMDNCLGLGYGPATYLHHGHGAHTAFLEYHRNTLVTSVGAIMGFSVAPDPLVPSVAETKRVRFEVSSNVFHVRGEMLYVETLEPFRARANWQKAADVEAVLAPLVGWREQRNVYSAAAASIKWSTKEGKVCTLGSVNLKDWQRRWNITNSGSFEGAIRFQGGDLLTKAAIAPDKITPEDFRLRSDSAGYQTGKGKRDLGADVDLVGPGSAYERWKKTTGYRQWLKETGQVEK